MKYESDKAEENAYDADDAVEVTNNKRKLERQWGKVVSTTIFSILGGLLTSQGDESEDTQLYSPRQLLEEEAN